MLYPKSLNSHEHLQQSGNICKSLLYLLISNNTLLLNIFLAVAQLPESKGLSCLIFLKIQPLEKPVAYNALLIKQKKCIAKIRFRLPNFSNIFDPLFCLLLNIFSGVAQLIENKGLSCLIFHKFQPLTKSIAYIALLIKRNKCTVQHI